MTESRARHPSRSALAWQIAVQDLRRCKLANRRLQAPTCSYRVQRPPRVRPAGRRRGKARLLCVSQSPPFDSFLCRPCTEPAKIAVREKTTRAAELGKRGRRDLLWGLSPDNSLSATRAHNPKKNPAFRRALFARRAPGVRPETGPAPSLPTAGGLPPVAGSRVNPAKIEKLEAHDRAELYPRGLTSCGTSAARRPPSASAQRCFETGFWSSV